MLTAARHIQLAVIMFVTLLGVVAGVTPVLAADCSDIPAVLCSCGDRVVGDKHLTGADPVTNVPPAPSCPGDGLIIAASGITLDMNGHQITGLGAGIGLKFEPNLSNVKIRDGLVVGFGIGIKTQASIGGSFDNLRILHSTTTGLHLEGTGASIGYPDALDPLLLQFNGGVAVEIVGNANKLGQATIRDNDGGGITVVGNSNTIFQNRLERNGLGISASGVSNSVTRNVISRGDGDGIRILGTNADVSQNQVKQGDGLGIDIAGSGHDVESNLVQTNGGDGFLVSATSSKFDRNQLKANDGWGIRDTSHGGGTSGTANTYTLNTCSSNVTGKSTPAGLCR